MQHLDEGMIHTWLDGELPAEEAAALEAHVSDCAQCTRAVAEARGLIAGSSRIVSSLDSVPGDVIPIVKRTHRAWYATTQFRAAAALLLVAGTSLAVIRKSAHDGGKVMLVQKTAVATKRAVATDAISPQASAPTRSRKLAEPAPTRSSPSPMSASNTTVAAVPAVSAPAETRQTEPSMTSRLLPSVSGRQGALRSAAPTPMMQDSAAVEARESAIGGNVLRLIRTDSMRTMTQRVFEMANGVQLIMTESNQLAFAPAVSQATSAKALSISPKAAERAARVLPAAPASDSVRFSSYRTITWVDAGNGRSYSLTGPFPPDQLEKFKALVIKLSQ
jgi:hypothetical protein